MIFVTLGTQDKSFHRLLEKIDELIDKNIIKDNVVVQAGTTNYTSKNMDIFDFISMQQFDELVSKCDLLITHGGVGSILTGLNKGKKVLAVARRAQYDEHENDHQVEIISEFERLGYIVGCIELDSVEEKIDLLEIFVANPYQSNNENFCNLISDLIERE